MNIALFLVVAAQGVAGSGPDWVGGASAKYPREAYLTGVGLGDERPVAEDRARGEISRIFSTLVTVNTSLTETEQSQGASGGKTATTFSQSMAQNVQTVSRKVLEGVEIADTWHDKAAARHYALAVLDRAKAMARVREKLAEFDKQAEEWRKQMEAATERLPRVKAAMKLMAVLKARENLNSELRVLDPNGKGEPSPLNEAIVRPQAAKALTALEVVVSVTGSSSREIETGIIKGLNSFGFEAKDGDPSQPADILVEGTVESAPMQGDKSAWKWARSTVTISLKDGRTSKIFLRFDASERQAAADQREAVRRSLVKLSKKVSVQIDEAIADYFENQ